MSFRGAGGRTVLPLKSQTGEYPAVSSVRAKLTGYGFIYTLQT